MTNSHRIGFIFLDGIYHLYHFLTVARELSKNNEVSVLTFPAEHKFLFESLDKLGAENVKVEQLSTMPFRAFTDKLKNRKLPRKGFWLKKNKEYIFNNFDAVIFTDFYHHTFLKARATSKFPKLIRFPHGVDGSSYTFKKDILDFDMNLIFGEFYFQELKNRNLLGEHFAVVGYPKLDAVGKKKNKKFFRTEKPVVLYNPHFKEPLSSWHKFGLDILEYFYNNKDYNLIFAPHFNLFQKTGGEKISGLPKKYYEVENIHIDLGSVNSVDMTYVTAADIYLGDVSSQAFEFMISPRPCIFLNPERIQSFTDTTRRLWKCGEVVDTLTGFKKALENAELKFTEYRLIQEKFAIENFFKDENSTPSERAALAISSFLEKAKGN